MELFKIAYVRVQCSVVCGPVSGQKIDFVKNSYPFLRDLKLADSGQNKGKIDLFIGANFY